MTNHPDWCGGGHVCTADSTRPGGEHRSLPFTVDTNAGRLVLTRIRTRGGADRVQITAIVDLPGGAAEATAATRRLAFSLCQAMNPNTKVRTRD